jgi:hypothetical protein
MMKFLWDGWLLDGWDVNTGVGHGMDIPYLENG